MGRTRFKGLPGFLLAAWLISLSLAAVAYYRHQRALFTDRVEQELLTVANLKVNQLLVWHRERQLDIELLARQPGLSRWLIEYLDQPTQAKAAVIDTWMQQLRGRFTFDRVLLCDTAGTVRLPEGASGELPRPLPVWIRSSLEGEAFSSDWHHDPGLPEWHMDASVPLRDAGAGPDTRGILVLRVNAQSILNLVLGHGTGILEGSTMALFDTHRDLVYPPAGAGLAGRETLTRLIATRFSGITRVADGGRAAWVAMRAVPDTPWHLAIVADQATIMGPFHQRALWALTTLMVLILGGSLALLRIWEMQSARLERERTMADLERQALVHHYDLLSRWANDIMLLVNEEGRIIEANQRAEEAYGYTAEELRTLPLNELRAPECRDELTHLLRRVEKAGGLVYETIHIRKDGRRFPVESSSRFFRVGGHRYYQSIVRDISERRRHEAALETAEKQYRTLAENLPCIVYRLDLDRGATQFFNAGVESITGHTAAELPFRGPCALDALMPEADAERVRVVIEAAIVRGEPFVAEYAIRHRDGSLRTLQERGRPHRGADGQAVWVDGAIFDITAQRQAQTEIQQLNRMYAVLTNTNQAIVRIRDREALLSRICQIVAEEGGLRMAWIAMHETGAEEARIVASWGADKDCLGRDRISLAPFANGMRGPTAQALAEGRTVVINDALTDPRLVLWRRDVERLGYRAYVVTPLRFQNVPVGVLALVSTEPGFFHPPLVGLLEELGTDISYALDVLDQERRQGEAERALDRSLRRSQELELILNRSPVVAFTWKPDPERRVEFVSDNVRQWGYVPEDLVGGNRSFASLVHADDLPRVFRESETQAAQGNQDFVQVYRVRRADGEVRWVEDHTWVERGPSGDVRRFHGLLLDITERRLLEQQLLQAQKMESIGTLAGGIAHDFNNLLQAIQGYAELLMHDLEDADPRRQDAVEIHHAATKAGALTRQLLAFSRKQMMQPQRLDLNGLISRSEGFWRRMLGEDVDLSSVLDPALWPVTADPAQVEQVLLNLVVNARDAMPGGGRITLSTRNVELGPDDAQRITDGHSGRFVCVAVADTGTGISPDVMRHLFEPFFSTKGLGKGTGLGLATAYGIVKQHEGWIHVYSQMGQGSVFKVYLPATSADEAGAQPPAEETDRSLAQGHGERILVVEDDESALTLAVRVLSANGYQVRGAASGREAMQVFGQAREPFLLVLSDVVLPDINGIDLLNRLWEINPRLKVILASGYTDEKSRWPAVQRMGIRFLQKPFPVHELLRAVAEVVRGESPA